VKGTFTMANFKHSTDSTGFRDVEAEPQNTVTLAELAALESYGVGGELGHSRAEAWIANPNRSNPRYGGTLQHILLDYAQRFANAINEVERAQVKGEIVGFSYRVECPAHALELQAIASARRNVPTPCWRTRVH
jgi:hypothetical protein